MYLKLIDENIEDLVEYYEKPFYVFLSLSNFCNANCKFCDVRLNKIFNGSIDVYNLIDELAILGTKYVHFTGGGEPFVNDDIYKYLEYCTKKGLKIVFISNGYNLNEEKIIKLSNYNIHSIFFSIDSYKSEIHDDIRGIDGLWNIVTNDINLVKKYLPKVKISLNHVLNKKNIDDFDKFILLKKKYNFDYINPIVIKDCQELFFSKEQIDRFNNNLEHYYDLAKSVGIEFLAEDINFFNNKISKLGSRDELIDLRCLCPSYTAFVDAPSGGVYPCDCSLHRDRLIYQIGDLKNESFSQIWQSEKKFKLKALLLTSELDCKNKCDQTNCLFNKMLLRRIEK